MPAVESRRSPDGEAQFPAGWGAALATVSAIGVVAAAPAVFGFRRVPLTTTGWVVVVVAQVLIAVPLSRVIMRQSVVVAVMLSAMGLVAALLAMTGAPRRLPPAKPGEPRQEPQWGGPEARN